MSDDDPYRGLSSVAEIYGILSTMCFVVGCIFILGAVVIPGVFMSQTAMSSGLPQLVVAVGFISVSVALFFGAWRFKVAGEMVELQLDMAEYAQRTAEAIETLAASVRKK